MSVADIFQRELTGEVISTSDPQYPSIAALIDEAQRIIADMNTGYREPAQVRPVGHASSVLVARLEDRQTVDHLEQEPHPQHAARRHRDDPVGQHP